MRCWLCLLVLPLLANSVLTAKEPTGNGNQSRKTAMTQKQASAFARLALKGLTKEYPNKPGDVLNDAADVKIPKAMHPAFYGCFDWHSSVHGHWLLVRVLRLCPDLPEKTRNPGCFGPGSI